jgi:hypothetical protein
LKKTRVLHIKKKNARIKKLVEKIDALQAREKDWNEQASAVISGLAAVGMHGRSGVGWNGMQRLAACMLEGGRFSRIEFLFIANCTVNACEEHTNKLFYHENVLLFLSRVEKYQSGAAALVMLRGPAHI